MFQLTLTHQSDKSSLALQLGKRGQQLATRVGGGGGGGGFQSNHYLVEALKHVYAVLILQVTRISTIALLHSLPQSIKLLLVVGWEGALATGGVHSTTTSLKL